MKSLDGKVAMITGGAGGIGAATVKLFVEHGARVLIIDIADEKGAALAREMAPAALYLHADVTEEEAVAAAVARAVDAFGRLDCLCNIVGGGVRVAPEITEVDMEGYDRLMNVTLLSAFLGMKHAAPVMKKQGSGSIINTASIAGFYVGYASHIYAAAKAALIQLTRTVATELGESGVRVNCICPGPALTPLLLHTFQIPREHAAEGFAVLEKALACAQPLRRPCLPEDVAQAALWLAGDASGFVNGHTLVVDGGLTCGRQWSASLEIGKKFRSSLETVNGENSNDRP